jgi:hypothetical protein
MPEPVTRSFTVDDPRTSPGSSRRANSCCDVYR